MRGKKNHRLALAIATAFPLMSSSPALQAQTTATAPQSDGDTAAPVKSLGVVTISGSRPTSLPTQIPTTTEGVTKAQIDQAVNASDSEDALKYFPSLLVRKRYIGDYNHAILSSRASGTGNSARSAVYADGTLLSNYLGNGVGGLSFPPRWGMVGPEEIERVDVMYGPFSAAYPGNSVGAVVVFTTRMPRKFEAHAKLGYTQQDFDLYDTHATYRAWEASASLGDKTAGGLAWLLSLNHADSHGQPLTFATRAASAGTAGSGAGTPVDGAVGGVNSAGSPWYILGTGTAYTTRQDQLKAKFAYDLAPALKAHYALGVWRNSAQGRPASYLTDASGQPVYSGPVNIGGTAFTGAQALGGGDFPLTDESLVHVMHAFSLKSHTRGAWDGELSASLYDYQKDQKRQNAASNPLPQAAQGGAGTLADGDGTGWVNLAAKGTWRPAGEGGAHIVDFGLQHDSYKLRYRTTQLAGSWIGDGASSGVLASEVRGRTGLLSAFAQDAWAFAPRWKAVLGLRAEQWRADDGLTAFSASSALAHAGRREEFLSPKAALSFQARGDLVLKASLGRAVRFPTVGELYGATSTANSAYINDPLLKPERSWTGEFSAEKDFGDDALLRATLFAEDTRDSLYSQTAFDPAANRNISRVQTVGRIETRGVELAFNGRGLPAAKGLDLGASVTYADSVIKENAGFVAVPGDTVGKRQPNIARWRATLLAGYRFDEQWSASLGVRYAGRQYRTLNNADVNGHAYQGVSKYLTADLRVVYKLDRQWSAAFGIDNLNNEKYWNFHPYPQRSLHAELKFDL